MSPEQVKCLPVTTRSDLFSVGAVLYEMVTGVKAFGAPDVTGILRNVVEFGPKSMTEVSADIPLSLSRFVEKLFAKSPDERFPSAVEALEELRRIRQDIAPPPALEVVTAESEAGVSTMAVKAHTDGATHPPSVTQVDLNDDTPNVSRPRSLLRRKVPAAVFWIVIAVALALPAGLAVAIRSDTNPRPAISYSPAQIRAFAAKKQQLRAARGLVLSGQFDQGVAAYEAYLQRYPNSPAAKQELADARAALDKAKTAKSRLTVVEKRPTVEKPKEPTKKPSFFQRIFGHGNTKQPPPKQPAPKKKP
jgi:hypothetical protein